MVFLGEIFASWLDFRGYDGGNYWHGLGGFTRIFVLGEFRIYFYSMRFLYWHGEENYT